jgi:hypothetical protein
MKITKREIENLERFLGRPRPRSTHSTRESRQRSRSLLSEEYFAVHPHLVMPLGFDEYVDLKEHHKVSRLWLGETVGTVSRAIFRQPSGQWFLLLSSPRIPNGAVLFASKEKVNTLRQTSAPIISNDSSISFSYAELFSTLYDLADRWTDEERTIWSPQLWTPDAQERQRITLVNSTRDILKALHAEKLSLEEVAPPQLEDIVAEVLRGHGMEIYVNRRHPQGGRDILARGVLIPGQELLTIAVEVKRKAVVDRPEVELALHQNKEFPALLFATSGRFTAGVLKEKAQPENQLRLFLKDGVALGDMIGDYRRLMGGSA